MQKLHMSMVLVVVTALAGCQERATEVELTDTTAAEQTSGTTAAMETSTPSAAGEVGWGAWNEWDRDTDNRLTREEYNSGFERVFARWAGTDNTIAPDEAAGTWRDWFDGNNDDIIDRDEWQTATGNWRMPNINWGEFDAWDTDRNAQLSRDEWRTGFGRAAANTRWTRDELADTWWDFWDGNDDNIVDANEWNTRSGYWGRTG